MTGKEFLQNKYPNQLGGILWNTNEKIDDDWVAQMLDEYHESKVKTLGLFSVSNAMLIDWWYSDENGTEVTVKAIVDKWCIVTDIAHDEPYNVDLGFVQNMYKDSIDC